MFMRIVLLLLFLKKHLIDFQNESLLYSDIWNNLLVCKLSQASPRLELVKSNGLSWLTVRSVLEFVQ